MKKIIFLLCLVLLSMVKCTPPKPDFVIAFGSCNKQNVDNVLWKEIPKHQPNVWIWGGDNIYADTDDMSKMKSDYDKVLANKDYKNLMYYATITGTWDDHDYGLNDGGTEFSMKNESQQLFLDFMGVPKDDHRRNRKGVYSAQVFEHEDKVIKILNLDTRYFRSKLLKSEEKGKRYQVNRDSSATILGEEQWQWLEKELKNSKADYHIIVTSIQFLSSEHGFEKWANFPLEQEKLSKLLVAHQVKNPIILSGDRHISEFSIKQVSGLAVPLIDFTSSGLTHAYNGFTSEPNRYRNGEVIHELSFGLLKFDFDNNKVVMEMRGKENKLQQQFIQVYN